MGRPGRPLRRSPRRYSSQRDEFHRKEMPYLAISWDTPRPMSLPRQGWPAAPLFGRLMGVTIDRSAPVLVTGSAGRIGQAAVAALTAADWRVRGFDRAPTPGAAESITGDLTDPEALHQATREVQAMIHLGASPDDDDFMTRLLPNNLVGLHHALEAAREAGVKRLLLASTGQVNWWQQMDGPLPIHPDDPCTPRHWYAVTKVAAEAAGKAFARDGTMTVLAVRLGWCPRTREQVAEIAASERGQSTYLSPGDAGRFFARALEADLPAGFFALFAASQPAGKVIFDLTPTKALLGWTPQDQWPAGAEDGILA